jgi:hypothetical protein
MADPGINRDMQDMATDTQARVPVVDDQAAAIMAVVVADDPAAAKVAAEVAGITVTEILCSTKGPLRGVALSASRIPPRSRAVSRPVRLPLC